MREGEETLPIYVVDAFTHQPFSGNPAAVCLSDRPLSDGTMLRIAREMNLSETAFPEAPGDDGLRRLRWFTPEAEVPLCGHATLATAHVLYHLGAPPPLRFRAQVGVLVVVEEPDGRLCLDLPADPPHPSDPPPGLIGALGLPEAPLEIERAKRSWVVRMPTEAGVAGARPDPLRLRTIDPGEGVVGVSLTAEGAAAGTDFFSRFLAPWIGVDEDPVTGLAHTALGPFWTARLDRPELHACQGLARGGQLTVRSLGERVHLVGSAVTVAEGRILIPD